MMTGGSLWPIIASLAMQGTPGDGASPPAAEPPAPAADPSLGDLTPPPPPVEWQKMVGDDLVTQLLEGRRRIPCLDAVDARDLAQQLVVIVERLRAIGVNLLTKVPVIDREMIDHRHRKDRDEIGRAHV